MHVTAFKLRECFFFMISVKHYTVSITNMCTDIFTLCRGAMKVLKVLTLVSLNI